MENTTISESYFRAIREAILPAARGGDAKAMYMAVASDPGYIPLIRKVNRTFPY